MSPSRPIPTCNLGRRDACKKMTASTLAAAGLMGSGNLVMATESPGKATPIEDDTLPHTIAVKVVSQKGHCGLGHEAGDTISFSEKEIDGPICIHALYAILPKIFAMMYDARFPWLDDPDVSTSACPDAANPVVFEISRKKTD
jgi:uncharacterized repeat protein (TIGR04076 family)